ncbi:MAG: hypothetical protein LUD84_03530 [Clostridiales bacterium]|nr:hypothetical protein [Clostridiales bacterium]
MLFIVVTVFALIATALIFTHWQQVSLRNGGAVLGTVLTGSVLWLLYCVGQLILTIYKLVTHIIQAIAAQLYFLTAVAIVLLAVWLVSLTWQIVTQKTDGFCGNGDISFGAREAVLKKVGISEDQPVGVVRCRNLSEYRCVAEGEQPIPAGTRVELVRWLGNKLVVRPLTETTSVA